MNSSPLISADVGLFDQTQLSTNNGQALYSYANGQYGEWYYYTGIQLDPVPYKTNSTWKQIIATMPYYGNGLTNRTTTTNSIGISREETRTTGTTSDNFNHFYIWRESKMNGSGGTFTADGSVLKLENISTQIAGTLTDTTVVLNLQQGAVTSTNFRRVASFNTITLWVSDGTSPNGVLSGNVGDICFGADNGQVYYCGGTTTWTAM